MPFAWSNGAEHLRRQGLHLRHAGDDRGAEVLPVVLHREAGPDRPGPRAPWSRASSSGKIGAFMSGPWHVGLLKEQGGAGFDDKFAVAPMPTAEVGHLVHRRQQPRGVQGRQEPRRRVEVHPVAEQARGAGQVVPDRSTDLPAVQSAWQDASLSGDPFLKVFGEQLKDAKSPPTFPTWEQVAAVFDTEVEKLAKSGEDPAAVSQDHAGEGHAASAPEADVTDRPRGDGEPTTAPAGAVAAPGRPAGDVRRAAAAAPGAHRVGVRRAVHRAVRGVHGACRCWRRW